MSAPAPVRTALAAARRRYAVMGAFLALPIAAAFAMVLAPSPSAATIVSVAALAAAAAWTSVAVARRNERSRAIRRLDTRPDMQDSADLLFADPGQLGTLQGLQRERLVQALATVPAELRPAWPWRAFAAAWLSFALVLAWNAGWLPRPAQVPRPAPAAPTAVTRPAATHTRLVASKLDIQPPDYTGLPASQLAELSGKAPEASQLGWTLRLQPQPAAVDLVFHDGSRLPLTREGDDWTGSRKLARSTLYRIVPRDSLPMQDDRLHRLDAIPDQPPQVRVLAPERSLSLLAPGQRQWSLAFEASDDHGLGTARLGITLAQGSGEQVTVSERSVVLQGEGSGKLRRYARTLDLGALGLAEGDDLIVRLVVSDNRSPSPQSTRSASFILRWPLPPSSESTGMEGLVKKALPAYFRSQRQIIIDAEALVAERGQLAAAKFVDRSDGIGVDQRILRMRYGQFLGEETAGEPEPPPAADGETHTADDGHGHEDEPPAAMGREVNVLEEYGHTHDEAEAATLLDPETRALLKQALDAMWLSEGELRQGQPERALPHAYRALGFIKQVQQATRIYLQRVGLELPPIDEARRMTGERKGLGDRPTGLVPASLGEVPALPLWQALAAPAGGEAELAAFADWLRDNEAKVDDALGLVAAVDALQGDPDCDDCRAALRARLWPLLPAPAATPAPRAAPDPRGQAYLDALQRERTP